jgi:hypothetical protein
LLSVTINISFRIFKEIEKLVKYIPIETHTEGIAKLIENTTIDTQFYFKDLDGIVVIINMWWICTKQCKKIFTTT